MKEQYRISAAVVSRNTRDFLRRALGSLGGNCPGCTTAIAVVENNSSDGSLEMVEQEFPSVAILSRHRNLGFARSVNLAFRELPGPFYLIMNADCRIEVQGVLALVERYIGTESAGVLGPRQIDEEGRLCLTWGEFPTPWKEWKRKRRQHRWHESPEAAFQNSEMKEAGMREVDWVSGSCWLVHSDVVTAAGPLDENYFLYFEDIDWCRAVREAGFRVGYVPEVTAVHADGRSAALEPEAADLAYRASQLYFAAKHWSGPERALLRTYLRAKFSWHSLTRSGTQRAHARNILKLLKERGKEGQK